MTAHPSIARTRTTWQRRAVLQAIEAAPCHLAADEIHRRLHRGRRRIGLATVYRALEAFVREGLVEPSHIGDGRVRYGLAARHHDHLVCLNCGEWEPLEECPVMSASDDLPSGFAVIGHRLEVYGYCAQCREAAG